MRSKDGNFRFDIQPESDISELLKKVGKLTSESIKFDVFSLQILETAINPDASTVTISNQPRGNEIKVSSLQGRTIRNLGLKYVSNTSNQPPLTFSLVMETLYLLAIILKRTHRRAATMNRQALQRLQTLLQRLQSDPGNPFEKTP